MADCGTIETRLSRFAHPEEVRGLVIIQEHFEEANFNLDFLNKAQVSRETSKPEGRKKEVVALVANFGTIEIPLYP